MKQPRNPALTFFNSKVVAFLLRTIPKISKMKYNKPGTAQVGVITKAQQERSYRKTFLTSIVAKKWKKIEGEVGQ